MNILFLLVCGFVYAFFIFWIKSTEEGEPSQLTSVAPVPTPTWKARNNPDGIPVDKFNLDVFNKASQWLIMQKQIMVNLKIIEYQLVELERFLRTMDSHGTFKDHPKTQTQR